MTEIDRVFARFTDNKQAAEDRRETLSIPRRGGATGSRAVEVVHVRSAGGQAGQDRAPRKDFRVRALTWEGGFPAREKAPARAPEPLPAAAAPEPTAHVMPAWEPAVAEPAPPAEAPEPPLRAVAPRREKAPRAAERRVADPFDAADDGANCMRCGYAIDPLRERRGLFTCAACG
ncbi:hypothetical protein [Neoroseomonas oryzicola]|uniref:Uncharacterized protein n=1 Tax=Neoroseomonas oryzicola TaxID=535904 RepID=A0A9X9WN64_9PROT|nr:hypothetical protein [Neoroseomonas oryzicola]MBR0661774.1 hypothetical protein [Neoroseomonas oryzicola]NKE17948.1 hypothetical protein [Neoroseomonas oryzicola]